MGLLEYGKQQFEHVGKCVIAMSGSFIIAGFFTLLLWAFKTISQWCGMGNSVPVQIASNFTEFEGICFVGVFVIANVFNVVIDYRKKGDN
jgi:hypothetical protein